MLARARPSRRIFARRSSLLTRALRISSGFSRFTVVRDVPGGEAREAPTAVEIVQSARNGMPGLLVIEPLTSTSIFGTVYVPTPVTRVSNPGA